MIFGNGSVAFAIIWGIVLLFYVLHGSFNYYKLISFGILPLVGSSLVLSYPAFDLTQLTALVLFTVIITIGAQYFKSYQISSRLSIGLIATVLLLLVREPAVQTIYTTYNTVPPRVSTKNGTLEGIHLPEFSEDVFLGIPYASPPVGELRLRRPVPFQNAWNGTIRDATRRGVSCPGYGPLDAGLTFGEDCLTLDIVRPAGVTKNDNLPIFVWIYGGNFVAGSSADPRYNTSYIVNASVVIHKPIIAVSINYRLSGWGFLASKEVVDAGEANIGLFDQRLALKWIQENIREFGGDPSRVTIAGESAGGFSVGYHLTGFDGDKDGLFRAAIMESGNSMGPAVYSLSQLNTTYQPMYDNVTESVGCSKATDTLACLRHVPYKTFYDAVSPFSIYPIVDGDFLTRLPSESFEKGLIADVAILAGTNTDECTAFAPRRMTSMNERVTPAVALALGRILDNDNDTRTLISEINNGALENNPTAVAKIMELYPDNPVLGCPFGTGLERFVDQGGKQYKRGAALITDEIFHAGRRFTVKTYASRLQQQRKPVYSFRFDQTPWNGKEEIMAPVAPCNATHFSEICHVFNIHPSASINNTNWIGPYPQYYDLSKLMSRAWISFIHDLDPNNHGIANNVPHWPDYSVAPKNFVFRVNDSVVEDDNWRLEQLAYWAQIWRQLST